jgi:hypothetical protein
MEYRAGVAERPCAVARGIDINNFTPFYPKICLTRPVSFYPSNCTLCTSAISLY